MPFYLKIFLALLLSACVRTKFEGKIIEKSELSKIQIGSSKENITKLLGSPSFEFIEDETLFYASNKKEWRAFLKPKIITQTIVEIKFTNQKVSEFKIYSEQEIKSSKFQTKITSFKKPEIY